MQTMDRNTEVLVDYMTTNVTELWLMMEWLKKKCMQIRRWGRKTTGIVLNHQI